MNAGVELPGGEAAALEVHTLLHRLCGDAPPFSSHQSCLGTHGVLLQSGGHSAQV